MNTDKIWVLLDKHFDTSLLSDEQIEKIDNEIELLVYRGQYKELTELGTKYNGPKKTFLDHYEERYKQLKVKIDIAGFNNMLVKSKTKDKER